MEVKVEIKNVYGSEKIYPACEKSKLLAAMVGAKTLTQNVVYYAKKLGFVFKIVSKKEGQL